MPRQAVAASVPPLNLLLAALPASERERLAPHLEPFALTTRSVLQQAGQPIAHVYFPCGGVVSQLTVLKGGGTIEVGLVGREGMVGLPVFLGMPTATVRSMVQAPGEALRMRADSFRKQVTPASSLYGLLLRYTHVVLTQLSQAIACNARHPVEKRLCSWLLMTHSRAGDRFPLTHEFLAAMLAVRRASVSEVAQKLQVAGLIQYRRGEMTILDVKGLKAAACECYQMGLTEPDSSS